MTSLSVSALQPAGGGFLWPTLDNLILAQVVNDDLLFADGFE